MNRIGRILAPILMTALLLAQLTVAVGSESPRSRGLPDFTFKAGSNRTVPVAPIFGDDVWFFITVQNIGDADYEGSYVIGFWLCWTGDPETSIGLTPVENDADMRDLPAGGSVEVNIVFRTLAVGPGDHTITVVVDDENLIEEGDEGNNLIDISYPIAPPDPIDVSIPAGKLTVDPPSPLAGDDIVVNATVLNGGPGTARFADVFLYFNDTEHSIGIHRVLTNISPSASASISVPFSTRGYAPGAYKILAFIHPAWSVDWMAPDNVPANNNATLSITLGKPEIDLRLDAFDISPARPRLGDTLEVGANITNIGTGSWVQVPVDIFLDGVVVLHRQVELPAGRAGRVNFSRDTSDLAERDHALRLKAANLDAELNFTLVFPKPDLAVQDMAWVPVLPAAGDVVTFRVKVANLGDLPSPECGIVIFAAGASSIQAASAALPGIEPGRFAWQNMSWNTTGTVPGELVVRAVVDPESTVAEDNRSNNALVRSMEFLGEADLALENLSIAPVSPRQGETVLFSVDARNLGSQRIGYANITLRVAGRIMDTEPLGPLAASGGTINSTRLEWVSLGFAPGSYAYELIAETGEGQGEAFRANNMMAGQLLLMPPLPRPDLLVGAIGALDRAVPSGRELTFVVTVENSGDGDANASAMAVSLETAAGGSVRFAPVALPPVKALGSVGMNVSVDTSTLAPGHYFLSLTLDYLNAVAEIDETNNHISWEQTILEATAAPSELRVTDIRIDGAVENDRTVVIRAVVGNTGDADATAVFVEFFIDGKLMATRTLDSVGRHGARNCTVDWTAATGQHTVKVTVSTKAGYGVAGQLPVTVPAGAAGGAGQTGALIVGTAIALLAMAALVIVVRRPGKPRPRDRSPAEEE